MVVIGKISTSRTMGLLVEEELVETEEIFLLDKGGCCCCCCGGKESKESSMGEGEGIIGGRGGVEMTTLSMPLLGCVA
jgi:hypothetical protein